MTLEFDDAEVGRELAELLKQFSKAPVMVAFIEKNGKACHGLARLAQDVRDSRKVPDFKAAGWNF